MDRNVSRKFYKSKVWQDTRRAYADSVDWICERCGKPGKIVHHKKHLTMTSINDPFQTVGFKNLELLCHDCHNKEHFGSKDGRLQFDEDGNVISMQEDRARLLIVQGEEKAAREYIEEIQTPDDILYLLDDALDDAHVDDDICSFVDAYRYETARLIIECRVISDFLNLTRCQYTVVRV